jgi:DNA polymerase delta subunit 2
MEKKPNCLKGMENMYGISKIEKFIHESDSLCLEDTSGRVKIDKNKSKININELVSGIPIALKGNLSDKGIFIADDYIYYSPEIKSMDTPMEIETNNANDNKNMILFISNLRIGNPNVDEGLSSIARSMIIDFIQNNNLNSKFSEFSKKIKKIILVGCSAYVDQKIEELEKGSFLQMDEYKKKLNIIIENYTLLDKYLKILSKYIHVDLVNSIEGNDGVYFPEYPNSPLLFLENQVNINAKTLNLVPNPYSFNIYSNQTKSQKHFLGTSGENINTIMQYTSINEPMDAMEKTLEWGHLAPLAPDTFRIYPYNKEDPLILNKIPDVYFISGKKSLNHKVIKLKSNNGNKDVVLLELPDFSYTFKGVLYNIDNDNINEIDFSQEIQFPKTN